MAGKKNDKKDAGAKDKKGKGAKGEEVAADANKQKVAQAIIVRHIIVWSPSPRFHRANF